ncbi:chemotaxis protein CheW [Mangrovitalea sediminis]|uniref:chemotaxis protein CheW n=1 Tax=Mangrovitalea sediminis TaxID=1982043 RepID=UPI000BE53A63|nr:chemotaxis protein CheW [Mangrovitalea sediminis]
MSEPDVKALPAELAVIDELAEQYLSFRCRGEALALPIRIVREIIEYGQVTPVPMMPSFIRGVINLRGHVVPVVDLAGRLGYNAETQGHRTCVIIMELQREDCSMVMGLVVDAVDAVLDIPGDGIESAPSFGTGIRTDFIAGMARQDAGFLIILNVDNVLSVEDLRRVASAGVQAPETEA